MMDMDYGIDIDVNVTGNAEAELGRIGQAFEEILSRAESTAYKKSGGQINPDMPGRISSRPTNIRNWQYDETGNVMGWTQGKRERAGSGGRRRGQGGGGDSGKELDRLAREVVKITTATSIDESRRLRATHATKQRELRQEEQVKRRVIRMGEQSWRNNLRQQQAYGRQHESRTRRAGRMAGRLMGRAFWDIVEGRQGTFQAIFKRAGQFVVTIIGEKLGEYFANIGSQILEKYVEGSETLNKAGKLIEKGLMKGADFLIGGLMKIAKSLFKMLEAIPGIGPIFGMIGGFMKHQGDMIAHKGMLVAHNGLMLDERYVKAQTGEMIINRAATRALHRQDPNAFDKLNRGQGIGGGGGATTINMVTRSTSNIEIDRYVRTKLSPVLHRNRTPFIKQ